LPGHTVESVPLLGWAGLKNGALLSEAEKRFAVLLTMDSNMVHQQMPGSISHCGHCASGPEQPVGRHPPVDAESAGSFIKRPAGNADGGVLSGSLRTAASGRASSNVPSGVVHPKPAHPTLKR
jgi:hypothetical protein